MRIPNRTARSTAARSSVASLRLGRVLAAAVSLTALAACDNSTVPIPAPADHRITPVPATAAPTGATALRGNLTTADFELASGVTTLTLHSGDIGNRLYQIVTPADAGVTPSAVVTGGGHVTAQLSSVGNGGPSVVDITLSSAVAWSIHLDGGATSATVDMHNGGLAALDFGAGVSRIEATVPAIDGTLPVRMSGGASQYTVHAPAGVPTRVTMSGGGGTATIDGGSHSGVAGGTVFTPDGWDGSARRIDVTNSAGVGTFILDRYKPVA